MIVYLAACATTVPFVPDDAYITFRYAESVADGNGLKFNGRDGPVEAYSNFLWVEVCAVLRVMGLPLPTAAPVLGLLFGLLTIVILWWLYVRWNVPPLQMLIPLLLVATSGPFVIYAVSGLETSFFAFLLMLSMVALDRVRNERRLWDFVALAVVGFLLAICRPEGVVAAPVILAMLAYTDRRGGDSGSSRRIAGYRGVVLAAGIFVALYAIYTVWRVIYFGQFLPTPFLSKAGGGGALFAAWGTNLREYFVMQGYEFQPTGYYFTTLAVLVFLSLKAMGRRIKGSVELTAFVLTIVYAAIYFNFVDWMPGMRYHAALVPLFFIPIVHLPARFFKDRDQADSRWFDRYALVTLGIVLLSLSVFMPLRLTAKRIERGNRQCLIALAEWIEEYTPSEWTLGISDVGIVPYITRRHTIDINPESLTDLHIAKNGWSEDYFYRVKPDIVILIARGVFSPRLYPEHFALTKTPRFAEFYRFIGTVRYLWYEDRTYWVFLPKDWPPLTDDAFDAFPPGIGSMRQLTR